MRARGEAKVSVNRSSSIARPSRKAQGGGMVCCTSKTRTRDRRGNKGVFGNEARATKAWRARAVDRRGSVERIADRKDRRWTSRAKSSFISCLTLLDANSLVLRRRCHLVSAGLLTGIGRTRFESHAAYRPMWRWQVQLTIKVGAQIDMCMQGR